MELLIMQPRLVPITSSLFTYSKYEDRIQTDTVCRMVTLVSSPISFEVNSVVSIGALFSKCVVLCVPYTELVTCQFYGSLVFIAFVNTCVIKCHVGIRTCSIFGTLQVNNFYMG